jgi:hypothetical protein
MRLFGNFDSPPAPVRAADCAAQARRSEFASASCDLVARKHAGPFHAKL